MSTATTMMSNHHRRFPTPVVGVGPSTNKRKERDGFDVLKSSITKLARPNIPRPGPASPTPRSPQPASSSNQLLVGYLAHEFLTKGTLFGEPWDPARAEAVPVSPLFTEPRRLKPPSSPRQKAKAETGLKAEPQTEKHQRYVEVTDLLRADGAHLPGIVNPAQLARLLQL